jgi:hypothetical protein
MAISCSLLMQHSFGGVQGLLRGAFTGGQTAANTFQSANFITAPRLPLENGPANGFASDLWGNDTKVTYYTPTLLWASSSA